MQITGTITILGSGTSQGVPVIGCQCEVCRSADPKDKRLRTAALVSWEGNNIAIDCGPDFRQQMLRENVQSLLAVWVTHEHNDHIIGLDDVRPFNFMSHQDMEVYATPRVIKEVKKRFGYIFETNPYPGAPRIRLVEVDKSKTFNCHGLTPLPVEVIHGRLPVLGFRLGNVAYITDAKIIPEEELMKLHQLDTLVLNALHHNSHHSHLNLSEALEMVEQLKPRRTYLTHISHRMGLFEKMEPQLPEGVHLAYDGLKIPFTL
jgi:phosphoribosyl 1,2-cyclic phosphate phosphodiesterase